MSVVTTDLSEEDTNDAVGSGSEAAESGFTGSGLFTVNVVQGKDLLRKGGGWPSLGTEDLPNPMQGEMDIWCTLAWLPRWPKFH